MILKLITKICVHSQSFQKGKLLSALIDKNCKLQNLFLSQLLLYSKTSINFILYTVIRIYNAIYTVVLGNLNLVKNYVHLLSGKNYYYIFSYMHLYL